MPEAILAILRIGHDTSMRGAGLSLRDALARTGYMTLRKHFSALDLVPLIQADGELVRQWLMYSEDKRTSAGWYVSKTGEIGRIGEPASVKCFGSIHRAVAEYVVRELDYWAAV